MPSPITLINGQQQSVCSVLDRGLAYGDGLFETLEVSARRPRLLERHLARLRQDAQRLNIPFDDAQEAAVRLELAALCERFTAPDAVAKITLTRGAGGRGYRTPDAPTPTRIITLFPRPLLAAHHAEAGIELTLCETRLGINPRLAGIKHLNRLEQVLARAEWGDEYAEGLLRDCEERVIEGTMSNLFLVRSGELLTPVLSRCGVAGVMRGLVIDCARRAGYSVAEVDLDLQTVRDAEALMMTNSLIGCWPVRRFQGCDYPVGDWHRRVQGWIADALLEEAC